MSKHPSTYMEELFHLRSINTFADLIALNNFVFSLIPWVEEPFQKNLSELDLRWVYKNFKKRTIGGWCGINAEFLRLLLVGYGIPVKPYNFGLVSEYFTHVVLKVDFFGLTLLLDPYFARYYVTAYGRPISFQNLLDLVTEGKFNKIWSMFGNAHKNVQQGSDWLIMNPIELKRKVMDRFESMGYTRKMLEYFGDTHFENLLLLNIPTP
jgi:hypothetical protein